MSEHEVHWQAFLQSLVSRGLNSVQLIISDAHERLKAARIAVFEGFPWQRCQFHLQQPVRSFFDRIAGAHVIRQDMRRNVAEGLRTVFNAPDSQRKSDQFTEKSLHYPPNSTCAS